MNRLSKLFTEEATSQGLGLVEWLEDGRVVIEHDGAEITVSLDNLSRNIDRDGNERGAVSRFVAAVKDTFRPLPDWSQAARGLRFSLEHGDIDFGSAIFREISPMCRQVLVYVDPEETRIRFVTPEDIAEWQVTVDQVLDSAANNMDLLLRETKLVLEPIENHTLGLLETHSVFKAALVTAPGLRDFVQESLGWPVLAVIPCRDFAYLIPDRDQDLIPRLGGVVFDEFENSGYPISTEVFVISDDGIEAIGSFGPPRSAT